MKTLREEILDYSGVLTEASKLSRERERIENHVRRTFATGNKVDEEMLERLTQRMKVDVVKDRSLEGADIPHFRIDMDIYKKFDGKKRFVFYSAGDKNETE